MRHQKKQTAERAGKERCYEKKEQGTEMKGERGEMERIGSGPRKIGRE